MTQTSLIPTAVRAPVPWLAQPIVRLLLVVATVAVAHGYSVTSGLWLDDHLHFQQLRQARWNYQDLVDASRLDPPATDRVRFWGTAGQSLRFYRPVAFAVMKAEYTLVGWRPGPMHVLNLAWNVAVAMLVGALATRLLGSALAGTTAAVLFGIFPNNVATVSWIACQTELLVAFFGLLAVLSYGRWSGWFGNGKRLEAEAGAEGAAGVDRPMPGCGGRGAIAAQGPMVLLVFAMLAYAAAMGCRENGLTLAGVMVAGDVLSGRRWRERIWAWAALAVLAGVYLVLRTSAMEGMALPRPPYVMPLSDPGFASFVIHKFLYYLAGLFISLPVVPSGTAHVVGSTVLAIGAATTVAVTATAVRTSRRIVLLGLVWPLLVLLPLLPVFPSPHHLYLPAVGSTILWTAALAGAWRWMARRWPGLQSMPAVPAALTAALLVPVAVVSFGSAWVFVFSTAAEDEIVAEVLAHDESLRSGDELFFINLPISALWVTPAIENGSGGRLHDLKGAVLTVADEPQIMTRPSRVTAVDRHTLRLEMDPPGWLDGQLGQVWVQVCEVPWPPTPGQRIPGPVFDIVLERIDPGTQSVTSLRIEFKEPIDKPGRHFYFGSPYQMAYPLRFDWSVPGAVVGPR